MYMYNVISVFTFWKTILIQSLGKYIFNEKCQLAKKLPLQITVKFRTMFLIKASSPKVDPSLMSYRCWMILESGTENGLIYLYI